MAVLLVALLVVGLGGLAVKLMRHILAPSDSKTGDVQRAASVFTQAWLDDDFEAASAFIEPSHSDSLRQWWQVSRKVWLARSNSMNVTEVVPVSVETSTTARLIVRFSTTGGTPRQTSQVWKANDSGWRFDAASALRAFESSDP